MIIQQWTEEQKREIRKAGLQYPSEKVLKGIPQAPRLPPMNMRDTIRHLYDQRMKDRMLNPQDYTLEEHLEFDKMKALPSDDEEFDKMIAAMRRGDLKTLDHIGLGNFFRTVKGVTSNDYISNPIDPNSFSLEDDTTRLLNIKNDLSDFKPNTNKNNNIENNKNNNDSNSNSPSSVGSTSNSNPLSKAPPAKMRADPINSGECNFFTFNLVLPSGDSSFHPEGQHISSSYLNQNYLIEKVNDTEEEENWSLDNPSDQKENKHNQQPNDQQNLIDPNYELKNKNGSNIMELENTYLLRNFAHAVHFKLKGNIDELRALHLGPCFVVMGRLSIPMDKGIGLTLKSLDQVVPDCNLQMSLADRPPLDRLSVHSSKPTRIISLLTWSCSPNRLLVSWLSSTLNKFNFQIDTLGLTHSEVPFSGGSVMCLIRCMVSCPLSFEGDKYLESCYYISHRLETRFGGAVHILKTDQIVKREELKASDLFQKKPKVEENPDLAPPSMYDRRSFLR